MNGRQIVRTMTAATALLGLLFGLAFAPFADSVHDAVKALTLLVGLGGGTAFMTTSLLFFTPDKNVRPAADG
jgi:ABC-type uncharacterized transport system permease subunit